MHDIANQLLSEFPHALDASGEERCGVVRRDGTIWQIANIHREPQRGFIMEPKSFLTEVEEGASATWHTHPGHDPALSEDDMEGFRAWPNLRHHIIGIRHGEVTVTSYTVLEDGVVVKA